MTNPNCRIGKIKPKSGGQIRLLPSEIRPYCHRVVHTLSERIGDETLAVGYFIISYDRTVATGWVNEAGTTINDLLGATEMLKQDIMGRGFNDC